MMKAVAKDTSGNDRALKRLKLILLFAKVVVVLMLAGVVTYLTDNFRYFEMLEEGVKYGIWHGFPWPFYFEGYHVVWGANPGEMVADWNRLTFYKYENMAFDFILYAAFIGGVLYLVEKGLKKILKVQW